MSQPSPETPRPESPRRWLAALVLAAAFLLALHYVLARLPAGRELLTGIEARSRDLAVLAVLLCGAWALGAAALRRWAPSLPADPHHAALAVGVGLIYHMNGVLLLAIGRAIRPWTLVLLVGLPLPLLWTERRALLATWRNVRGWRSELSPASVVAGLAVVVFTVLALSPPNWTDALTYHLAIPQEYIAHGGVPADHGNFFHNFPNAFSMVYVPLMALGSDRLPKLLHLVFLFMTLAVALHHFRKLTSSWVARYAILLFLCQWTVDHGVQRANVDFQFGFYGLSALLLLVERQVDGEGSPFAKSWPIVCGLLLGAGLSGKIQAVACFGAAFAVLLPGLVRRHLSWRQPCILLAAAFAAYLPTLARNVVDSFDPFLFFIGDRFGWTFGAATLDLERFRALAQMKPLFMTRPGFLTFLFTPLFIYTDGAFPTTTFDGFLDPLYLIGLPLAALLLRRASWMRATLLALAGYYAVWMLTAPLTRYALPALPLVALATVAGYERLCRADPSWRWLRGAFAGLIVAICGFNVAYFAAEVPFVVGYSVPAFFDLLPRRSFLEKTGAIYGMQVGESIARIENQNGRREESSRRAIFMILASEVYYLPARYFNDPFYVNLGLLEKRQAEGRDPIAWLRDQGYGYVVFEPGRIRWLLGTAHKNPLLNPYPEGLALLGRELEFFRRDIEPRLRQVERHGPLVLYSIPEPNRSESSAGRSG